MPAAFQIKNDSMFKSSWLKAYILIKPLIFIWQKDRGNIVQSSKVYAVLREYTAVWKIVYTSYLQ